MKQIKIVTAVDRIPVASLQGMIRISKTEVRLPSGISWEPLVVKPHAQLTVSDKVEDKNRISTVKLSFKTCDELSELDMYAFRCKLADGKYRLIGNHERPYPIVNINETMPENVADNQLNEVIVSWQTTHFVPYIQE